MSIATIILRNSCKTTSFPSVEFSLLRGDCDMGVVAKDFRAPRIISYLQGLCGHEKAAEEAAEQENLISTIDEIS